MLDIRERTQCEPNVRQEPPNDCMTSLPAKPRKLLLIEFNELCPPLLDRWMASGDLPNFRTFYDGSQVFVTESDEVAPNLEPWIQWYTVHTGLSFRQHGVFNLTDGPKAGHPDIWDILAGKGLRVANFSSMNCKGFEHPGSAFLPDPWCTSETAYPAPLQVFHRFVSNRVQEYTNRDSGLSASDYIAFAKFLLSHGLRPSTCGAVLSQLGSELLSRGVTSWRRASLLDRLQLDVFRYYLKANLDFATFFSNSTAHYQHSYWRYFEPERFSDAAAARDSPYAQAIYYGYRQMDRLIGELLEFERRGYTLMLATALSQQPFLKFEDIGGQNFYRPRNVESLLAIFGISSASVTPVMTHQYILKFRTSDEKEQARRALRGVTLADAPVFDERDAGELGLYFGNAVRGHVTDDAEISVLFGNNSRTLKFYDLFYRIAETKSGYHHPDGVFWMKLGRHKVHPEKISILDVFPTLLDFFQVKQQPDHQGMSVLRRTV